MKSLETSHQELYEEFMNGNFVVKKRDGKFNQVPIDQATEWQNKICKISNGIIGITRNDTARDKFCMLLQVKFSKICFLQKIREDS